MDRYNTAARACSPARSTLTFKELTEYAYLANFDFLKYSEHGALEAEWGRPMNRRGVELWQRICRAKEEIIRLNVEIRRVRTHILDEEHFLSCQYERLKSSNPDLAYALLGRLELLVRVNQRVTRNLEAISKLKGFSGDLTPGTRINGALDSESDGQSLDKSPLRDDNLVERLRDPEGSDVPSIVDELEIEPSDEAEREMTVVEETCTTQ